MIQREVLTNLIKTKILNPKMGIEIGTLEGDTLAFLLGNIPTLDMITIDPGPVRKALVDRIDQYGRRVHIIELESDVAIGACHGPVDFVWVDGDHSYEQVRRDIQNYHVLVSPSGFIGGHDYGSPTFPGVKQAVDELFGSLVLTGEDFVWYVDKN